MLGIGLTLLLVSGLFFGVFPMLLASRMNQHGAGSLPPMNAQAQSLHSKLLVVDLHAASLLWSRDLLDQSRRGHVDLPRLTDGNIALQVFSAVSRLTWRGETGATGEAGAGGARAMDLMTPLVVAQLWPVRTWGSRLQRALYQADKLKWLVRRAGAGLITIRSRADIDRLLLARSQAQANGLTPPVGAMLSLDDTAVLEGELANLDILFDAGFRMAVPPAGFDADAPVTAPAAGAGRPDAQEPEAAARQNGLTPAGRSWLGRMEEKGMVVDVAHASGSTLQTIVAHASRPVVASHAGLRGTCDNPRNLTDDHARGIAATGGVIGIGFWREAVCDVSIDAIVKAIRYAVALVGVDHVALGSNFDGGSETPIDAAGLGHLTHGLTAAGFSDDDIAKLAGGNALRVLRGVLPP